MKTTVNIILVGIGGAALAYLIYKPFRLKVNTLLLELGVDEQYLELPDTSEAEQNAVDAEIMSEIYN